MAAARMSRIPPIVAAEGGLPCIEAAWTAHRAELRGYLRRHLSDGHAADDLLQDLFIKALRQGSGFCRVENPRAWLFQLARNALIDRARTAKLHLTLDDGPELEAPQPEPVAPVDALAGCIARVLGELPTNDAAILRACDLDGDTQKAFAQRNRTHARRRESPPAARPQAHAGATQRRLPGEFRPGRSRERSRAAGPLRRLKRFGDQATGPVSGAEGGRLHPFADLFVFTVERSIRMTTYALFRHSVHLTRRHPRAFIAVAASLWWLLYQALLPASEAVVAWLPVERESHLGGALQFFLYDTPKVLLLLTAVVFVMGMVNSYFTPERTRALLAGRTEGVANVMAASLGIVTPFCSCSAVPLFIGFVQAGVPLGVTFSFLISAPMVNEVALALLFGLFGWKIALLYLGLGLAVAIVAGWVIGRLRMEALPGGLGAGHAARRGRAPAKAR